MRSKPNDHSDPAQELSELRALCWRQSQEINALNDTISVLRNGANRLAADNAIMSAEIAVRGSS